MWYTINCGGGETSGKMHIESDCSHTHRSLRREQDGNQSLLTATQGENWSARALELGGRLHGIFSFVLLKILRTSECVTYGGKVIS